MFGVWIQKTHIILGITPEDKGCINVRISGVRIAIMNYGQIIIRHFIPKSKKEMGCCFRIMLFCLNYGLKLEKWRLISPRQYRTTKRRNVPDAMPHGKWLLFMDMSNVPIANQMWLNAVLAIFASYKQCEFEKIKDIGFVPAALLNCGYPAFSVIWLCYAIGVLSQFGFRVLLKLFIILDVPHNKHA